ncbi:MAG: thiol peroxidase [Woeseiaceae bacterium]
MSGTIVARIRFDNATYRTWGELPRIGSSAPDVSLANWTGKRKIMNILVSVDTEVGATSVIKFDEYGRDRDDVALLMVSYDLPFAHRRFQKQHGLEKVEGLSAIRHAGFGENYGVQIMAGPLAGMFSGAVIVLDEHNTVVHREHLEDILTEPDYSAAFRALGIKIDE